MSTDRLGGPVCTSAKFDAPSRPAIAMLPGEFAALIRDDVCPEYEGRWPGTGYRGQRLSLEG
jgi:hypothetical protein